MAEEKKDQNWSELPNDVVELVAKRLPCLEDFSSFGMVCQSWQSITLQKHYFQHTLRNGIPWLMLTERESGDDTRGFYSILTNKIHNIYLPETRGRRCWGTPYGWLITFGLDMKIHLLNPLTRARIQLPKRSTFKDPLNWCGDLLQLRSILFHKFVMRLASPSSSSSSSLFPSFDDSHLIMALYSTPRTLAVARVGDEAWTHVEGLDGAFMDMACINGQFYAVNCMGGIYICNVDSPQPTATYFADIPETKNPYNAVEYYLVEMGGEFHVVIRLYECVDENQLWPWGCNGAMTQYFEVYKMDICTKEYTKVESFEDYALFIGNNSSFVVSIANNPGFKGNCIYFTDDAPSGFDNIGTDMGVFDYKDRTNVPFYIGPDCLSDHLPPTLITPNLW